MKELRTSSANADDYRDQEWMTVKEAAAYLRRCVKTVYRKIESGDLTKHQITENGKISLNSKEVISLIKRRGGRDLDSDDDYILEIAGGQK